MDTGGVAAGKWDGVRPCWADGVRPCCEGAGFMAAGVGVDMSDVLCCEFGIAVDSREPACTRTRYALAATTTTAESLRRISWLEGLLFCA